MIYTKTSINKTTITNSLRNGFLVNIMERRSCNLPSYASTSMAKLSTQCKATTRVLAEQ